MRSSNGTKKAGRVVMPRDEAVKFFTDKGEHYKAEIINDLPEGEIISLYRRAILRICAVGLTFPPPAKSATPSN